MTETVSAKVKKLIKKEVKGNGKSIDRQIKTCLENCDLLSIFEPDYQSCNKKLDNVILQALLKANKDHVMDLLHLVLTWNRIDIAKREIFTSDEIYPTGYLDTQMHFAIKFNRTDFVELFIAHSVSLSKFLTKARLDQLYNEIPEKCLPKILSTNENLPSLFGSTIRKLIEKATETQSGTDEYFTNPSQRLFIWSLLMMRQDMAKLFWAEGRDPIAAALVAHILLKALKSNERNTEIVNKLQCNINEWSDLAVGVLRECYATDELKSQHLLLLVCVLFPPLALVLLGFRLDHEQDEKRNENKRSKDERTETVYSVKDRINYFYNAPVIIFMNNVIFYLVFLGLFTYILLFKFEDTVSEAEIVLIAWFSTIILEEIRQILQATTKPLAGKFKSYITDMWNILDMVTIGLFIIGLVLRLLPQDKTLEAARVFLALSFVSFCLRLLHIFSAYKGLGPKLVMIGRMLQDLLSFVVILMVFVVSYAVASHSILFPNTTLKWNTPIEVLRTSYWNIYGELALDDIREGAQNCTNDTMQGINDKPPRCPKEIGKVVVPLLMAVYMLLASILLLNLLIAMFSNTYQLVQDNADKHWCFQRYSLIYEYYTRTMLSPPLIIFSIVYLFMKWFKKKMVCHCSPDNVSTPISSDKVDDFHCKFTNKGKLEKWEKARADDFHQKTERKDLETTSSLLKNNRIEEVPEHHGFESRLEHLEKTMAIGHDSLLEALTDVKKT